MKKTNRWLGRNKSNKSPHRKSERRLTFERVEPRVLLTATVNVQAHPILPGQFPGQQRQGL